MKKTISIILVAALMTGFAACGSNENKHDDATTAGATADTSAMHEDHSGTDAHTADSTGAQH